MKLNPLLSLEEYIKSSMHNPFDKKVIFVKLTNDIAALSGDISDEMRVINTECLEQLFVLLASHEDSGITLSQNLPILYYGGHNKKSRNFIDKYNFKLSNMYNTPDEMKKSGSKVEFAKMFKGAPWLPRTVFSKEEAIAGAVGFPVVAKVTSGHSGVGIQKFDTANDLKKSKDEYDLFCEFIDFDREYRTMFINDKCFMVNERIPTIKDNKTIRTKKSDEKVSFTYVYTDMNKIPTQWKENLQNICDEIREKLKLGLWSLDVVVDKNGKAFVMETNSATGLGAAKLVAVYKEIYEDYYQRPLPDWYLEQLNNKYVIPAHLMYYNDCKEEIAKCPWAIDYQQMKNSYKNISK
jgi:hypothetical protein